MPKQPSRTDQALPARLVSELKALIEGSRAAAALAVNTQLTMLYWRVGRRIRREVLACERAEYGKRIVVSVSRELSKEYGKSFNEKQLRRMIQFAETYAEEKKLVSLIRQLSWTHFIALIPIRDDLKRGFYEEMCRLERWSVRQMRREISSHLFERTALSKEPKFAIRAELERMRSGKNPSPNLFLKDHYLLDFLGLDDRYIEKDVEDAILREMEQFILELGAGFSFVARQYRITVDDDDFYIDLLFYNRLLKRHVVVDLKLDDFKPAFKGQMELYLRWLDKYERREHEEPALGLILCAGKKREQIELLELGEAGIHVAEYLTDLPSRKILESRFRQAVARAKSRLSDSSDGGRIEEEMPVYSASGQDRLHKLVLLR